MKTVIGNLVNLNNSESVAAATAVAMLGGPQVSDQLGTILSTVVGLIGLSPNTAGGISALYALFRLWKKHRSRKLGKGLRAVFAALAASSLLLASDRPAWANGDTVELVVGKVNQNAEGGDDDPLDGSGNSYAVAWDHPFRSGAISGHLNLQRLDGFDNPAVGAYCVDLVARLNFGDNTGEDGDPAGRVRAYIGAGLGGVWADRMPMTAEVTVTDGETTLTGTGEVMATDQFLLWNLVGGARLFFTPSRDFGVGVEYSVAAPINADVPIEGMTGGKIYLIVPASPGP